MAEKPETESAGHLKKKRGTIVIELNDQEVLYKGHVTHSIENTLETPNRDFSSGFEG
jgi:hypothetical protein